MTVYIDTPAHPAIAPRAFRQRNGAWETSPLAEYQANGDKTRWYGFNADLPESIARQVAVTELRARRAARGMSDPLNVTRAVLAASDAPVVTEMRDHGAALRAIRAAIVAESVSYSEIAELQAIGASDPDALGGDDLLCEWAGLAE